MRWIAMLALMAGCSSAGPGSGSSGGSTTGGSTTGGGSTGGPIPDGGLCQGPSAAPNGPQCGPGEFCLFYTEGAGNCIPQYGVGDRPCSGDSVQGNACQTGLYCDFTDGSCERVGADGGPCGVQPGGWPSSCETGWTCTPAGAGVDAGWPHFNGFCQPADGG
ncbi:MAG TPA: hypothetical protein VMB50_04900 [Myxococcales bacterium]|nr:hypothetical protein [Myxococcales bacterium]